MPHSWSTTCRQLETSDALLFVDARCFPVDDAGIAGATERILGRAPDPPSSRRLRKQSVAGTKERVSFDATGQVRGIQRHYEDTSLAVHRRHRRNAGAEGFVVPSGGRRRREPASLFELRQFLSSRGAVPSRDVPIEGGALNLSDERRGILSANERLIPVDAASQTRSNAEESADKPMRVGDGHSIGDDGADRQTDRRALRCSATIEDGATILGPVVIGAGAPASSKAPSSRMR